MMDLEVAVRTSNCGGFGFSPLFDADASWRRLVRSALRRLPLMLAGFDWLVGAVLAWKRGSLQQSVSARPSPRSFG